MSRQDFERLGVFYLGKVYDLGAKRRRDDLVLYDSRDLVTHAVCVGMTGSGKTGLCLSILEEAAIDGVPAIAIDPKGDLGNLLLTFPDLLPADFRPWINEDDARRKSITPEQFAEDQAALWKRGLAEWGQDGDRIRRLKAAADFAIYTPGSGAGLPVSILRSFSAPGSATTDDPESLRERASSAATALLGLIGVDADPIRSREHILLSTIFTRAWQAGRDLDLPAIIQQVQNPPVQKVGVMDVESFFPAKDRFTLSMQLNNLLGSPGFSAWLDGEALDIDRMLWTPEGRPRISIFSIAHLNDAERMFFVSLLMSETLAWARRQTGTTSLRALVYMDEIAGYFPPVANPPSKAPMLTLMKQARAFGVGMVLATQNPVDLDYKGLSNAGTWFIGRLQTERDKARLLDGLEGAAAGASARFDRSAIEKAISSLASRVFLMNNVHDEAPEIFETRWAMSYLRGPLTRAQIKTLMDPRRAAESPPSPSEKQRRASDSSSSTARAARKPRSGSLSSAAPPNLQPSKPAFTSASTSSRPLLPPDVPQCFLPVRSPRPAGAVLEYRPFLLGFARIHYADSKSGIDATDSVNWLVRLAPPPVGADWDNPAALDLAEGDVESEAVHEPSGAGAAFASVPPDAAKAKSYDAWKRQFADALFRAARLELLRSPSLKETSRPGESERAFRLRLDLAAREARDDIVAKLRQKYAPKMAVLQDRIRRAQQAVETQKSQARQAKAQTAISFGAAILSAILGRRKVSVASTGRATTAARGVGRSMKESGDVGRAEENVEALQRRAAELDSEFQAEFDALTDRLDPAGETLETISLRPKKSNISIRSITLAWAPHWVEGAGEARPAYV